MISFAWRLRAAAGRHRYSHARQSGQALAEGIVVLGVLLFAWGAISWLGRYQDMALSTQHASRHAAFQQTRGDAAIVVERLHKHFFSGPAHRWLDRQGQLVLNGQNDEPGLSFRRLALDSIAQPGGRNGAASTLRSDWGIQDQGVLHATVSLAEQALPPTSATQRSGWLNFAIPYPALRRHTAILTGAGHASGDIHTQQMVAASGLAWGVSAGASYAAGEKIASIMNRVDSAWGRTEPEFDWLTPWAGRLPRHHLAPERRLHD
ncbi:MAG TPA: pilus assembly protein [Pusillimonas sp.]